MIVAAASSPASVTRWPDYFSTSGHLHQRKFSQWQAKFAKVDPKISPNSK